MGILSVPHMLKQLKNKSVFPPAVFYVAFQEERLLTKRLAGQMHNQIYLMHNY